MNGIVRSGSYSAKESVEREVRDHKENHVTPNIELTTADRQLARVACRSYGSRHGMHGRWRRFNQYHALQSCLFRILHRTCFAWGMVVPCRAYHLGSYHLTVAISCRVYRLSHPESRKLRPSSCKAMVSPPHGFCRNMLAGGRPIRVRRYPLRTCGRTCLMQECRVIYLAITLVQK